MERNVSSDKMGVCREVGCSLLMLLLGIIFCLPLGALTYFSFLTLVGEMTSCALWVDIPGRLAIFVTCYYIASMCGFFPLPQQYHLNTFIEPFIVWRLESWSRLFRNVCFSARSLINCLQTNVAPIRGSLETPILQEKNEQSTRDDSQWRRQSEPIDISYPKSYIAPVFVSNLETTPRNESSGEKKDSNGSITSVNFSVGDFAFPIMKGKSSIQHHASDASIEELPDDQVTVPTKYRKRYTEIKWAEAAAANAPLPVAYDHTIAAQRPTMNKKSAALTDDERRKISRQQRRRIVDEMPQVHMIDPVFAPRLSHDENEQLLEKKSVTLTEDEKLFAKKDTEIKLKNDMLKARVTEGRFRVPTAATILFPRTNKQRRMHGKIKHSEETTLSYKIKSPPKYRESNIQIKGTNAPTRVQDDHPSVKSGQLLAEKYFALTDDERHATAKQQEPTVSTYERSNLLAADEQFKATIKKKLSTETKFQLAVDGRNRQPGRETATIEQEIQPKLLNIETEFNFPVIRDKNQKPGEATSNQEKVQNTETPFNFPRFPWYNLRNPRGVSAWANKLHKKNLELEKREMERYFMRQRSRTNLDRSDLNRLVSLRSERMTKTQFSRRNENTNLIGKSSFQMRDFPMKSSDGKAEIRPITGSGIGKDNIGLTKNRYKLPEMQNMEKIRATSQVLPPLFVQRSGLTQRQDVERSNDDEATTRRRRLPSQRFQAKLRSRSRIQDKAEEKKDFKLVILKRDDAKDSGENARSEVGSPNTIKQDTERTGILGPVTEKNSNEHFNRLQLEGLRRRLVQFKYRPQIEASARVESKQNDDTKIEVKTTDVSDKKSNESTVSATASDSKKPLVKITMDTSASAKSENDSDWGPET